jgi:membrane protein
MQLACGWPSTGSAARLVDHSSEQRLQLQTLALRGSMRAKELWPILKTTFTAWNGHEAPRLGAALTFYTILSLSPLVILVVALAVLFFSRSTAQAHILSQVQGMIGPVGGKAVESMLANSQKPAAGILGTIVGLLSLLFRASGVFTELRSALNLIW